MKRGIFLSIVLLLVFPTLTWSNDFLLSGFVEVGKRSTADDYQDEDTDDDYAYRNYHLRFGQKISNRLNYNVSSFIYKKDYNTEDSLDNISRIFKASWSYQVTKSKEKSLQLDLGSGYKQKRYHNRPKDDYDQIVFSPSVAYEKENFYRIDLDLGMDVFKYSKEEDKNQSNFFGKIGAKRYLSGKKLMLTSSYRIQKAEQKRINRHRTKHQITAGLDWVPGLSFLDKLIARGSWGWGDTKEDDQRDQDFDYEYWGYYVKAEQEIGHKLDGYLKYEYFKKEYVSFDWNHKGFSVSGGLDYNIIETEKQKVWLDLEFEFKRLDYTKKASSNYEKSTGEIGVNYQRKKEFKVSTSLQSNTYKYNDSNNDKNRYYWLSSGEKVFKDGHLVLSADFKYRYTNYRQKSDSEQTGLRSTFEYRF